MALEPEILASLTGPEMLRRRRKLVCIHDGGCTLHIIIEAVQRIRIGNTVIIVTPIDNSYSSSDIALESALQLSALGAVTTCGLGTSSLVHHIPWVCWALDWVPWI